MGRYRLKWVYLSSIFFLMVGFSILGLGFYQFSYCAMMENRQNPVIIELDKYASATALVSALKEKNLIRGTRFFLLWIRMQGLARQLKAGLYQVMPGESAQHFLQRVAAGDVLVETFRIIEGTTQYQVAKNLQKSPYLTHSTDVWGKIAGAHASAEGLLLADTYRYNAGSDSFQLLTQAHQSLERVLQDSWLQRSQGLPYSSAYELLIAASIIEKEAAIASEKRLISGVIVNRLRKKMRLQMDPTVIYALGPEYEGPLKRRELRIDSPYNTYRYHGLPPTPIAMVGQDAIEAAAHPIFTDYLYYVAKGDGSHQFSVDYEQQKQAVEKYISK